MPEQQRILICGDRNWQDQKAILRIMQPFDPHTTTLICGMARGADLIAYEIAKQLGWSVLPFPANWIKEGRAAGPIRNKRMLVEGKPTLVIAFHDDLANSKGTANMVEIAKKAGIPLKLIKHRDRTP